MNELSYLDTVKPRFVQVDMTHDWTSNNELSVKIYTKS
jgi:hypothetical protein